MSASPQRPVTVYEAVGGAPFFQRLIERFYAGVEADEVLRPLYPDDLTESIDHMVLFLMQYWGGPTSYNEQRGHPRLRMRHAPFPIGESEKQAWLSAMMPAVEATCAELDPAIADQVAELMQDYFVSAAAHMVNTIEP